MHVLLVDPIGARRRRDATTIRASGRRVTEAATPLEAIYCLDAVRPPQMMVVADTAPLSIGEELRAYVVAEHHGVDVRRTKAWNRL